MMVALTLMTFLCLFWASFLNLGVLFGGCLGVACVVFGVGCLRDIRRQYLENGLYITSRRVLDVHATRRSFRTTALSWSAVENITTVHHGLLSVIGYGAVCVRGADAEGFSLVVDGVWKPDLVVASLAKVQ